MFWRTVSLVRCPTSSLFQQFVSPMISDRAHCHGPVNTKRLLKICDDAHRSQKEGSRLAKIFPRLSTFGLADVRGKRSRTPVDCEW